MSGSLLLNWARGLGLTSADTRDEDYLTCELPGRYSERKGRKFMTETPGFAPGSAPVSRIFDRFPPQMASARASMEANFGALDHLVVRHQSGQLLIDENTFRGALQGLSLTDQQINGLISQSPDTFTSASGLRPVPLSELASSVPAIKPATDQQLDDAGLHVGSDVQTLRAAFEHASNTTSATLNMTPAELRQRIRDSLISGSPQTGVTADVTLYGFLNCLLGEVIWIVAWTIIHALALWGVSIGAIVVVGISTAVLWWLVMASFGLGFAFLVFRCLF